MILIFTYIAFSLLFIYLVMKIVDDYKKGNYFFVTFGCLILIIIILLPVSGQGYLVDIPGPETGQSN